MAYGEVGFGNSQIGAIRDLLPNLERICDRELADQYNTFQYVVKNLEKWADETTIGKDLRSDMLKLVQEFEHLMYNTKSYVHDMDEFLRAQQRINDTNNY